MTEWKCPCGEPHQLSPAYGPGFVCRCGRAYGPPGYDVGVLVARVGDLEREVRELREWRTRLRDAAESRNE